MPDGPILAALDSDYDGAWKEILESQLEQSLRRFFPVVHAGVNWSVPWQSLDQELHNLLAKERSQVRRVDKLVQVTTLEGQTQCLLIHLEVQSFSEPEFARRIYHYHQCIRIAHEGEPVISLVLLADLNPNWHPREFREEIFECLTHFRFPTCKLLDLLPELEGDFSIPALAAKAQIEALRSSRNPEQRYQARWRLVRSLYEHGYSPDEVRRAYRMLAWMMMLPEDLMLKFKEQLISFEKEYEMPYVADTEVLSYKMGRNEGLHEGLIEGKLESTLQLLARIIGVMSAETVEQINALSLDQKDRFCRAALDFHHLSEVQDWLRNNA